MHALVTCKNKENAIKSEGVLTFSPLKVNFEPFQDFMIVLVTCKKEDPIKNEGARVFTTFSLL